MHRALLLVWLSLLGACSGPSGALSGSTLASDSPPAPRPQEVRAVEAPASPDPYTSRIVIGKSVEDRPLVMHVVGHGAEVVLVLAGIHGNERACTPLAEALLEHLGRNPATLAGRTVLVVPDANPDGRVANTRINARGVDLNRNFPAANRRGGRASGRAALSEPESEAIERVVRIYAPARVLSLHQPLACVDYDGPARELAERIARETELPVRKLGTRPGSMGAWLGEGLGVALITLELPRSVQRLDAQDLWRRYGAALLRFVSPSEPR